MVRKIVSTLDTCGGAPRIDGTRLTCGNVVLALTHGRIDVNDYLKLHDYLTKDDLIACAIYCSMRDCVTNQVPTYCQGCSLDFRDDDPCADEDHGTYSDDCRENRVNIWEDADDLVVLIDS